MENLKTATPIAPVPACWPLSPSSETVTSDRVSAASKRNLEDFKVVPIAVAELEFRDIERQVLGADLVERAGNASLEDGPEPFNRVRVHGADNVLATFMVYALMRVVAHSMKGEAFVCREQADLVGHHFAHESLRVLFGHPVQNAGDNVTLALYSANDRGFTGTFAAPAAAPLVPVAIGVLAADPSVVNLDNAHGISYPSNRGSSASRYAIAASVIPGSSSHNPSTTLHLKQSRPRTSPVTWQWSTASVPRAGSLQIAQAPPWRAKMASYCSNDIPYLSRSCRRLLSSESARRCACDSVAYSRRRRALSSDLRAA